VDFTRQPIIETIITPKEGCKLVVRNSKNVGQEEYFVDSLEVVSFGSALFYRSVERPKIFLVPVSDYEVLEIREARMVLKNIGVDRNIKIGGGKEAAPTPPRELPPQPEAEQKTSQPTQEGPLESRLDKRRDKRRHVRRRRGREDEVKEEMQTSEEPVGMPASLSAEGPVEPSSAFQEAELAASAAAGPVPNYTSTLLPPPSMLISETIARYRENALFKEAFYSKEDQEQQQKMAEGSGTEPHPEDVLEALSMKDFNLEPPVFGSLGPIEEGFNISEESEESQSKDE
jgi:hypothetical protein